LKPRNSFGQGESAELHCTLEVSTAEHSQTLGAVHTQGRLKHPINRS